ncbi:MAG: hypothetical protein HFH78_12625 [Lachnospiraceae bacterium]|jgi:hypothetical protein|nr:hypothetical protein [Lachnospiraceae bacterium]
MKNQIIKKIMAYLLVGAMVITTPMTASAAGLADAYDTGTGSDEDKSSNTDTNTDTNTNTGGIKPGEIPPVVEEFNINIFGIALDKETLDFDLGDEEQSNTLQARVLFDGYDPSNEDMQWAVSAEEKAKIEKNIHWYSSNPDVAEVRIIDENDNTKAMVIAKGDGEAKITAWIEADGIAYNNSNEPTPGDYKATAIVTVTEHATGVSFNYGETPFVAKRQYDLNDYTYLSFKNGSELVPIKNCQESVTFSNMKINNKTTKATLKDGILKITKSLEGDIITFNMVTEGGLKAEGKITIAKENPVTKLTFANNKMAIDMGTDEAVDGVVSKESNTLTVEKKDANAVTTDLFTWTESSKGKVINVTGNGDKATITAVSVGSSTVTVKASSGKSAKLKVTVTATPSDVKIEAPDMSESGYVTYTGKPTTMTAVLYGKNGIKIPQGKTKLAWTVNDKSYAKVSSKGIVTPANILYAKNSKGKLDKKNLVEGLSVTSKVSVSVKGTSINDDYDLKIDQSNVESFGIDKYNLADTSKISKVSLVKNKATLKDDIFVGQSYNFVALATGKDPEGNIVDFSNATAWTVSGKGINSKVNEATLQTKITSKVKATVKASYITISKNVRSGAYSAKKNTATITISPIQMANTLTLNKNAVVVNPKKGNNKVTLNVKALAPKGATDKIMWKVMSRDAVTGTAINGLLAPNADLENQHGAGIRRDAKNKKLTVTIPGTAPVGSVIKVGAYAEGGAVAYAYIYVTDKTTKVVTGLESVKPKNTISLKAGETAQLTPKLVTANGEKAVGESKWSQGNTIAYDTEPVSYILDKKSAQYVKVDANGKIVALQKGTAKVTIKTISGKSAKVTIKIAE